MLQILTVIKLKTMQEMLTFLMNIYKILNIFLILYFKVLTFSIVLRTDQINNSLKYDLLFFL